MEKRLAASAAGLKELALLREKHQQEVEDLLKNFSQRSNINNEKVSVVFLP